MWRSLSSWNLLNGFQGDTTNSSSRKRTGKTSGDQNRVVCTPTTAEILPAPNHLCLLWAYHVGEWATNYRQVFHSIAPFTNLSVQPLCLYGHFFGDFKLDHGLKLDSLSIDNRTTGDAIEFEYRLPNRGRDEVLVKHPVHLKNAIAPPPGFTFHLEGGLLLLTDAAFFAIVR